ncbi:MAG: monovalent cation:proton antiporter-2 (CPA2) family protein, partial [Methyloceanibacter sp.]
METAQLIQVAVFLAAAAIAAPLGRSLRMGAVLGYLAAGVVIGPYVLGPLYALDDVGEFLHFGEFGVVMLLFVIGLELRPVRLWAMRSAIFGLGTAQLAVTAAVLAGIGVALGLPFAQALFIGLALSLSSTAFALQVLEEKGELTTRHGRLAFSVLLFQDLAAIPLIALVPLFAFGAEKPSMDLTNALIVIGTILGVIVGGRFLLSRLYRIVAATGVREAMTASALLTVVGVALAMEAAGLSAALGAFIAGALLADSEYRHQIEADIAPFEGLLLAVFFIAVGMSIDLGVLVDQPVKLAALVLGFVALKAAILYLLGRWWGLDGAAARRLGLVISQGGEFAFVLFGAGALEGVIDQPMSNFLTLAVTLSMAATPLLLLIDDAINRAMKPEPPDYEMPPDSDQHVIVAGFGRFGQIVARVLRARRIPFTALDSNIEQVDFVKRFGAQIYYGDAGRIDILRAAGANKARAFVLAIDDVESSLRVAEIVRTNFPNLKIYARARDRTHVHKLMDLGVTIIERETFVSALALTKTLLR